MIRLSTDAKKITPVSATVDFYEFKESDFTYFYFDTSFCGAPEPMVNAMIGLRMLEKDTQKLVMINHSIPNGLFPKIKEDFDYEVSELDDGNCQVIFTLKNNGMLNTDFEDNQCSG